MDPTKIQWALKNGSKAQRNELEILLNQVNFILDTIPEKNEQQHYVSKSSFELVKDVNTFDKRKNGVDKSIIPRTGSSPINDVDKTGTKNSLENSMPISCDVDIGNVVYKTVNDLNWIKPQQQGLATLTTSSPESVTGMKSCMSEVYMNMSQNNHLKTNENNILLNSDDGHTLYIENMLNNVDFQTYECDAFDEIIEYVPFSDDDDDAIISGSNKKQRPKTGSCDKSEISIQISKSGSGLETEKVKFKSGSCDKSKMIVQTSDQAKKDKKNCCPYCLKLHSKLARHITTMHTDETDVQDLLKFLKNSKERKGMLDIMKKKGNYEFNTNANLNNGQLIVSRRPNPKFLKSASDFSTCYICLGFYTKTSTHICSKRTVKGDRSSINLGRLVEGRVHSNASETLQIVLSVLKEDHITIFIKYDWLLILLGNELCEQYDVHYQHNMIRSRLRLLSRVFNELIKIEPKVTEFASMYDAELCDSTIEAIRMVGKFDSKNRLFGAPWPTSNAVTQVKRVGRILRDECIAKKDKEMKEQVDDFIHLFTSRATYKINKLVINTLAKMKREKIEILPTNADISQVTRYLNQQRKEYFKLLNEGFSLEKWINLLEVTMASMMLFNRRRAGEMQNFIVSQFVARERRTDDTKDQMFLALTDKDKKSVLKYSRMRVRGKRGRPLSMLLQKDVEICMELLLKYREAAGISSKNDLFFALPSANPDKMKSVNVCATLVKLSQLCGAENPKSLRGTKLRKHFAEFVGTKDVSDSRLTDVAGFMGHHEDVHKKEYRGNPLYREIAVMSGLLEEASGNCEEIIDESDIVGEMGHSEDVHKKYYGGNSLDREIAVMSELLEEASGNCEDDIDESDIVGEMCHHASGDLNIESTGQIDFIQIQPNKVQFATKKIVSKRKREPEVEDEIIAKKISRVRYTAEEKSTIIKIFQHHIVNGTIPSKKEVEALQNEHSASKTRSSVQLRSWIGNLVRGSRKIETKNTNTN